MKTFTCILLLAAITFQSYAIDFVSALQQKKVKVEAQFFNLGKEGLTLELYNPSKDSLKLIIEGGTIFIPKSNEEQTLLNVEEEFIVIAPMGNFSINVGAYCTMLHKHVPTTEGNSFSYSKTTDQKLLTFVNFVKQHKIDEGNYQQAVWVITDNQDLAFVDPDLKGGKELRDFLGGMTSQPAKWYTIRFDMFAIPGQPVQRTSSTIEGFISLQPNVRVATYLTIEDANHKIIRRIDQQTIVFERNDPKQVPITLVIGDWESGKYTLTIRNQLNSQPLKSFEFGL